MIDPAKVSRLAPVDPAARAALAECTRPSGNSRRVVFKGVPGDRNALFYDST